jgi:hypothetical protein
MQQLLQMIHAQWAYRNTTVYLEIKEGQTAAAHEIILGTTEGILHTGPEELLQEHHHLLFSDFAALASGPIKDKLEWISKIDSALGAPSHVARGPGMRCRPGNVKAIGLVHRLSTSWSWWMQRGV